MFEENLLYQYRLLLSVKDIFCLDIQIKTVIKSEIHSENIFMFENCLMNHEVLECSQRS